jgi:hypothetical protein
MSSAIIVDFVGGSSTCAELPELSPRELAVCFTDEREYFVSEAPVYRLLKAHDLITSPAYVVIKAANEFKDKTTAINQLWQTDLPLPQDYWLGLVLSVNGARRLLALTSSPGGLAPTMCASDVMATLDQALAASGLDHITVRQRLRLFCNGSRYLAGRLEGTEMQHVRALRFTLNPEEDRALAPDIGPTLRGTSNSADNRAVIASSLRATASGQDLNDNASESRRRTYACCQGSFQS